MSPASNGGIKPKCEAWLLLRELESEIRIWGDTPEAIWKQIHQLQDMGYGVLGLRGINGRI